MSLKGVILCVLALQLVCGCAQRQSSFSILMQELPQRINPADSAINYKLYVLRQLFEPLFVYSAGGNYESRILSSWSASHEHREFRLCLRVGMTFSNGKVVTVRHLLQNVMLLRENGLLKKSIEELREDEGCALARFEESYPAFPSDMSSYSAAIIDPDTVQSQIVVGISPYAVKSLSPNVIHLASRNGGLTYSDIFFYKWTEEDEPGKVAYRIEDIDDFNQIPAECLPRIVSQFNKYDAPILTSLVVILNAADKHVRQIVFNCLDHDELRRIFTPSRRTFRDIGGILPDGVLGAITSPVIQECKFRPLRRQVQLRYLEALRSGSIPALQEYVDRKLLPLNIKVRVERVTINALADALLSREKPFDMTIVGMDAPMPDPYSFFAYFLAGDAMATSVQNEELRRLMDAYLKATVVEERQTLAMKANQALLDNYQLIPLYQDDRSFYFPKRIRNIGTDPLFLSMLKIGEL